jgi:hypothetical protein
MAKTKVLRKKSRVNNVEMDCFFCGSSVTADSDTRAILCSRCTARLAGSPIEIHKVPKREVDMTDTIAKKVKAPNTTKPNNMIMFGGNPGRGWHLRKEYVAPNGRVYNFGKLISEGTATAE